MPAPAIADASAAFPGTESGKEESNEAAEKSANMRLNSEALIEQAPSMLPTAASDNTPRVIFKAA